MKIVATNQAATNVDATQILQDRAVRLQGEGARPRKLQEADATADTLAYSDADAANACADHTRGERWLDRVVVSSL